MSRVLLTCGIGDFIAIESHLTAEERAGVEAIHWATRARESLMDLIPFVFPNVKEHVVERDTWGEPFSETFCITSRAELPDLDPEVVDWNVRDIAGEIRTGARSFHGSCLLRQKLANIESLPRYFVIHPFSENARTSERDLSYMEWMAAQRYVHSRGYATVIVNKGGQPMPTQFGVFDYSDKLSILQTLEVTKRAAGFIGCASFPAVLAAQSLTSEWLFVKSNRSVKTFFYWLYYAPQESNAFLTDDLRKILHDG